MRENSPKSGPEMTGQKKVYREYMNKNLTSKTVKNFQIILGMSKGKEYQTLKIDYHIIQYEHDECFLN